VHQLCYFYARYLLKDLFKKKLTVACALRNEAISEDSNIFHDGQLLSKDMKQIYFDQV
jgi:hypothetical protein